ncbi:hypothetical protein V496_06271 [Pseudogymnoascus sp. VKM F-4515 (FW-2607)]|nr:hypothetical protein V496_06271 [Pseudogymnoascus sp. VKM F-4515 (FW-2607)]
MLSVEHNLAASSIIPHRHCPDHHPRSFPHHPPVAASFFRTVGSFAACSWLLTVTSLRRFVGWPYPAAAWSILAEPTEPRDGEPGKGATKSQTVRTIATPAVAATTTTLPAPSTQHPARSSQYHSHHSPLKV